MVKKELRIGNIINVFLNTTEGKHYRLGVIHCLHMNTIEIENNETFQYNMCEPIPLSEEWLIKFGFLKQISYYIEMPKTSTNNYLEVVYNSDKSETQWYCYFRNKYLRDEDDFVLLRKDLRFVHELQNLYYALAGEDLKISI